MTDHPATNPFERHAPAVGEVVEAEVRDRPPRRALAQMLLPREAAFVAAFVGGATPLQAMLRAGYSAPVKADAEALMGKPAVRDAIARQVEAIAATASISAARILAEHAALAFSDPAEAVPYLLTDSIGEGTTAERFAALPRRITAAIRKVKVTRRYEGKGEDARPVDTLELEYHDKHRSLDALAKVADLYRSPEAEDAVSAFGELLREAVRKSGQRD